MYISEVGIFIPGKQRWFTLENLFNIIYHITKEELHAYLNKYRKTFYIIQHIFITKTGENYIT